MADDVTKKDLQSLQGYVNKQIADVNKQLAEIGKTLADVARKCDDELAWRKQYVEHMNRNDAELLRGHNEQNQAIERLRAIVNDHARHISALQ